MARGDVRLTDEEKTTLLREYDAIPLTNKGRKVYGYVDTLCRKWGVTKFFVQGLVDKRRKDKRNSNA